MIIINIIFIIKNFVKKISRFKKTKMKVVSLIVLFSVIAFVHSAPVDSPVSDQVANPNEEAPVEIVLKRFAQDSSSEESSEEDYSSEENLFKRARDSSSEESSEEDYSSEEYDY